MSANRAHPFGCVVLAAGAGTRFGEPKAGALVREGVRFLDAVCEVAHWTGADPSIAVVPPGVVAPPGVRSVVNANAAGEQVASLRLGLAQLTNTPVDGALVWPVDHPFVRGESVLAVLDAAWRTGAPIVLPVHDGRRGHPVWFARDTWRELMTVPSGGARAVVHAYGARVTEVPVLDVGVLRDVDTKADLEAARPGDAHLIESGTHVAHPLTQALVRLGRDAACEVLVRDATVSRRHAEVRSIGTTRVLTVTGSTGARVNDSRISAPVTLAHGDRIEIGLRSYVYHQGELPAGISSYVGHGQEAQLEAQQDPLLARTTQSNPVIDRKPNVHFGFAGGPHQIDAQRTRTTPPCGGRRRLARRHR